MIRALSLCLLAGCGAALAAPAAAPVAPAAPSSLVTAHESAHGAAEGVAERATAAGPVTTAYAGVAARILAEARGDRGAYEKLAHLTDHIGNRLSGSRALEEAIVWAQTVLGAEGHERVHAEPVLVPHWVRGDEAAEIVAPLKRPLVLLGLGMSPATPRQGLTAPLVVVRDFDELTKLGASVHGKIVLYNHPMPPYTTEEGSRYGDAVVYRGDGPSRAAAQGAVAALVRSVTARSLRTPHTGATRTKPGVPTVPSAAVTVEDAELLARLAAEGPVRVHLTLTPRLYPDAPSANVIAELRGRERPDEIVLLAAHLDSWDVGQGAHDDGAGVVTMMQALTTLRRLGLVPRRTIRVVLYTNEENGLAGGKAYAREHAEELARHVAALESDSGGFAPVGLAVNADDAHAAEARRFAADVLGLLAPLGATRLDVTGAGADISPLSDSQVPTLGLEVEGSRYFDYHHTQADTLDKVSADDLALDVAAVATLAYVLADLEATLPRNPGRPRD